jgi:hypothetical protein
MAGFIVLVLMSLAAIGHGAKPDDSSQEDQPQPWSMHHRTW